MQQQDIFTPECRLEPYWWRAAPHVARAGRSVVVLDAAEPGHGASTRNAGYVGRTLKHTFGELLQSSGLSHALRVYQELMQAFRSVKETIEAFNIDCFYR